jgi:hypothetical protein
MIQTFTIQKATPSQNETDRMHWAKRRLLAKEWALLIMEQIRARALTRATGKRRLTVERHGKRELDEANAYGGVKQVIDEMVRLGLLVDDDPKHLSVTVKCEPLATKTNPFTVFTLEDQ